MAKVHVLRGKRGDTLLLTLAGKVLVTGEGPDAVEQTFPSPSAAAEHLERVLGLRRREGYVVAEVREPPAEPASTSDPLASVIAQDPARRRATVTFQGAAVAPGLCARVFERIEKDAPRCVQVICDPASPGPAFAAAFAGRPLPSVEAFVFDTHFQTVTRQRDNACGDLATLLAALPSVTRVFATGKIVLTGTSHERLRELYLLGDPITAAAVHGLEACRFPALETLGLQLYSDAGIGAQGGVAALLPRLAAPLLRAVHVDAISDVTRFLKELTASPLPATWRTLRFRGQIDDEDELLAVLKLRGPRLGTVARLGLPLVDNLSEDAIAAARKLLRCVVDSGEVPEVLSPATYEDW